MVFLLQEAWAGPLGGPWSHAQTRPRLAVEDWRYDIGEMKTEPSHKGNTFPQHHSRVAMARSCPVRASAFPSNHRDFSSAADPAPQLHPASEGLSQRVAEAPAVVPKGDDAASYKGWGLSAACSEMPCL